MLTWLRKVVLREFIGLLVYNVVNSESLYIQVHYSVSPCSVSQVFVMHWHYSKLGLKKDYLGIIVGTHSILSHCLFPISNSHLWADYWVYFLSMMDSFEMIWVRVGKSWVTSLTWRRKAYPWLCFWNVSEIILVGGGLGLRTDGVSWKSLYLNIKSAFWLIIY